MIRRHLAPASLILLFGCADEPPPIEGVYEISVIDRSFQGWTVDSEAWPGSIGVDTPQELRVELLHYEHYVDCPEAGCGFFGDALVVIDGSTPFAGITLDGEAADLVMELDSSGALVEPAECTRFESSAPWVTLRLEDGEASGQAIGSLRCVVTDVDDRVLHDYQASVLFQLWGPRVADVPPGS